MLSADQVEQFRRDGFLRGGKQVLSDEVVETLREEMARVIRDRDKGGRQPVLCHNFSREDTPVWQIVNIWEASAPYHELISNPTVVEEVAQLTGAHTLRMWHDQIQYKPAQQGGINMWHQDSPYWPILMPKTEQVTAWIALDDVDAENGCMSMVPGSYHWGVQIDFLHTLKSFDAMPDEFEGHRVEVRRCPVAKGEVHFHHALTWHGSPSNTSSRPRRAIALHYMTDQTRYREAGNHVMKPFVEIADGEVLRGEHFPVVYTAAGVPVPTGT